MPKPLKIIIDGYLKRTVLGREGEKEVTFEYSSLEAIKIAQLELMGRDLLHHLPVLLRTTYEVSPEKTKKKSFTPALQEPKQRASIKGRKSADA